VIQLQVTANLDLDPWNDDPTIAEAAIRQQDDGLLERVGVLPNSMLSGRATVQLVVRLGDGTAVLAQTSLRNFLMAAAIVGACPVAQMEDL
jgi:hypothetical protein